MYALGGKSSINCIVLYPIDHVSAEQEMQMLHCNSIYSNTRCFGVCGSSDELDAPIEQVFKDTTYKNTHSLGSVNSVNILRLLAQIVHFFSSYFHAIHTNSTNCSHIHVSIPSGAAGHLTAALIAKTMGLPIQSIIVATNSNDILYRFILTGILQKKNITSTYANAMDISVPYNIERILYLASNRDIVSTKEAMDCLRGGKEFTASQHIRDYLTSMNVVAYTATDDEILRTIRLTHSYGLMQDPHTCVGIHAALSFMQSTPVTPNLPNAALLVPIYCMGCASPVKFRETIRVALGGAAAEALRVCELRCPHALALAAMCEGPALRKRPVFGPGQDWVARLRSEIESFV